MTLVAAPTAYFTLALDQAKEDLAKRGVPIFDFGVGDPNEPTPEFIRQALIAALDPVSQYPTVVGQRGLRQAIAGWAKRRLDVTLNPDPVALCQDNGYRLELEALGPKVLQKTRIAWINYPHNPTGASVDLDYLRRQVDIARDYSILLCADDCYLDLYFA